MKIHIEDYRGQTIEYDDDDDKFICDISIEDKSKTTKRASLKDVKREIDAFVKLNLEFKPQKVFVVSSYDERDFAVNDLTGIRTDGKFVVKSGNYSNYFDSKDMKRVMVYDETIMKEKEKIESEIDIAQKKHTNDLKQLVKKLVRLDISKYKM